MKVIAQQEDARLWGGRGPLNRLANLVQPLSRGEAVPYHTLDDVLGTQANAAKPSHWIVLLGCVLLAAEAPHPTLTLTLTLALTLALTLTPPLGPHLPPDLRLVLRRAARQADGRRFRPRLAEIGRD